MHRRDILETRGLAGADCPDRFISDGDLIAGMVDIGQAGAQLVEDEAFGITRVAGCFAFAAAKNDSQARIERKSDLSRYHRIGFTMRAAALAVAQNDKFRARIGDHRRGNITGVRAIGITAAVLRAHADLLGFAMDGVDQCKWRRDRHLHLHVALRRPVDRPCFGKHGAGAVHLPVSNDVGPFGHAFILPCF